MKNIKKAVLSLLAVPVLAFGALAAPVYAQTCDVNGGVGTGVECAKGQGQSDELFGPSGIFTTVVNVLLFIIGAIAVIMLVIGGMRYTLSGGDANSVKAAKDTILYAVIGIVVAILAYAIVNWVVGDFAN